MEPTPTHRHWHDLHWLFDDRPRWQQAVIFFWIVGLLLLFAFER
jgi:hypothetical protein